MCIRDSLMLANSELLVMLNQAATDREELAKLLNISENQLSYITNVPAGHGLIRCGGAIIPFENLSLIHILMDKINAVGFWSSIPLWAVTLLGGLFITVLSFVMIMTVYGRMFRPVSYTHLDVYKRQVLLKM